MDRVITELLKATRQKYSDTQRWAQDIKARILKERIYFFIRNLEDEDLLAAGMQLENMMAPIQLLCVGDWTGLDSIVHAKSQFIEQALKNREELEQLALKKSRRRKKK